MVEFATQSNHLIMLAPEPTVSNTGPVSARLDGRLKLENECTTTQRRSRIETAGALLCLGQSEPNHFRAKMMAKLRGNG